MLPWMLCIALRPRQKLGMILVYKVVQKIEVTKKRFYKKCAPKQIFSIEIKIRKIWMIFDLELCTLGPSIKDVRIFGAIFDTLHVGSTLICLTPTF